GPRERNPQFRKRLLQRQVAHQGSGNTLAELAAAFAMTGDQIEQLVAVVKLARAIHHQHPIAVSVESDSKIRTMFPHSSLQRLGGRVADMIFDVETIGTGADGCNFRAELVQDVRRDMVGSAVSAVDHDMQAPQIEVRRKSALAELDIAANRVIDTPRLAKLRG